MTLARRARAARDRDATRLLLGLLATGSPYPRLKTMGFEDKEVLDGLGVDAAAARWALREDLVRYSRAVVSGLRETPTTFAEKAVKGTFAADLLANFLESDPVIEPGAKDRVSHAARDTRLVHFILGGVVALVPGAAFPYKLTSELQNAAVAAALSSACGVELSEKSTLADAFSAVRAKCRLRPPLSDEAAMPEVAAASAAASGGATVSAMGRAAGAGGKKRSADLRDARTASSSGGGGAGCADSEGGGDDQGEEEADEDAGFGPKRSRKGSKKGKGKQA